jgi:hypothetical protein
MKSIARAGAVTVAVGVVSVVASATALGGPTAAVSSHKVSLTGKIEAVSSTGAIGVPGVRDTDAGILDGTISGSPRWHGALRQVATWGSGLAITSQGTAFAANGSFRFKLTGKFVPSPTGVKLSGKLAVTGGTGTYNGARGSLRVTGTAALTSGTGESTFDLAGTLRYP